MNPKTISAMVPGEDQAIALLIAISLKSQWVQFEPMPDDWYRITVKAENRQLLEDIPKPAYALIQEGGSSTEMYLHSHTSMQEAEDDRKDCEADGGYRTSPITEIPASLAALGERFYAPVEAMLKSTLSLGFPSD